MEHIDQNEIYEKKISQVQCISILVSKELQ